MPTTASRRSLTFATIDQVMPDVDRLLDQGYRPVGHWTLGQVCYHLTRSLTGAVEPLQVKVPWILRRIIGPYLVKNRLLKSGKMPEGAKGPPILDPSDDLDDRAEAEALRAAVRLFSMHGDSYAPHPLLGPLTPAETHRLHCIHCAHHLSFLLPGSKS